MVGSIMRKSISTWHMAAGKIGSEHSWGVFTTAELPTALKGWGVSEDNAAWITAEAEKSAPADGSGALRHSALVTFADESGDPIRVVRHA